LSRDIHILRADRLDCRLTPHRWVFEESHAAEIDEFWRARTRENAALYDGRVLLASRVATRVDSEGRTALAMSLFETRFSRFLAWREFGFPDQSIFNCFAMPALRSAEGAFLVGEMGRRHSSPGLLYFPCGTPDPADVLADGSVDLDGSLRRELAEETGLSVGEGALAPGWTIVFEKQRVACVKIIDSGDPADAILARVEDFLARESDPELAGAHMIGRRDQLDDPRFPPFMTAFLGAAIPAGRSGAAK